MLTITRVDQSRLVIDVSGKIDSEMMTRALDELSTKSSDIEHGQLLYQIGDIELPTLGAIAVELSRLPQLFGLIKKFDRAAVLAEQRWIKTLSEIEGMLLPGLTIKAFDRDQLQAAETWLAG